MMLRFQNPEDFGFTPLDNAFIEKFMPYAQGDFVKVYIMALKYCYNGQTQLTNSSLAAKLNLLESDVVKAWDYWSKCGLININKINPAKDDFIIEFVDPKNPKVVSSNGADKLVASLEIPEYKQMFDNIEMISGRTLSPKEMERYLDWIEEYSMSPEVVIMLIQYCISKGKNSLNYMDTVSKTWHDEGIRTIDDVEVYLKKEEQLYQNYKKILKFLGLDENDMMEPHKEYMAKWLKVIGFDLDVVLEACKACILNINKPNFSYIDKILASWAREGIKTMDDYKKRPPQNDYPRDKNAKAKDYNAPKNYFNDYKDQRKYNVTELEKKLLARSRGENVE